MGKTTDTLKSVTKLSLTWIVQDFILKKMAELLHKRKERVDLGKEKFLTVKLNRLKNSSQRETSEMLFYELIKNFLDKAIVHMVLCAGWTNRPFSSFRFYYIAIIKDTKIIFFFPVIQGIISLYEARNMPIHLVKSL